MGLFGKLFGKKENGAGTTTVQQKQMWVVECGPKCGFLVRDHNKDELVRMAIIHNQDAHNVTLTAADVLKDAKPVTT